MIEELVLSNLIHNEEYTRRVIPFLKSDYFDTIEQKEIFKHTSNHIEKYNTLPTKESLRVEVENTSTYNESQYKDIVSFLESLTYEERTDIDWLIDKTESFCQDKAVINAVKESIVILDGKHKTHKKESIPTILSDALGVSFDANIGHDFFDNSDERFEYYHKVDARTSFDIEMFNKITKGGLPDKSLTVLLGGTGAGKTLFMGHFAAGNLMNNKNVLYITLEMAEEEIAKRIDANILDITLDDLMNLPKTTFDNRITRAKSKSTGKLIIKEYPTASASAANFRYLINELRLKKNFDPDIVYIDYINLCTSARLKNSSNFNSYTLVKSIAEELRGLAVEMSVPIVTATQMNRSGFMDSDPGLENTSESFGLPATADMMFAIITSEELENLGQVMIKQLKNRWCDINSPKRFVVGVDRSKMKLYDVDDSMSGVLNEDVPVMDNSKFGERFDEDTKTPFKKFRKRGNNDFH